MDISTAADTLRVKLQPHVAPPVREQRARKAPARSTSLSAPGGASPVATFAKAGAKAAKHTADPAKKFPARGARPDRNTVRSVEVVGDTIQVTLASGTNARTKAAVLLADVLKGGADGFPVTVVQHDAVIAKSAVPIPVPAPDPEPGKVDTVVRAATKG